MDLDGVFNQKNMGILSQNCRGKSNCDNVILEFRKYDGCLISFSR